MTTSLKYTDTLHSYYMRHNGKAIRCTGATTVAKVAANSYNLERWSERMVALGVMQDANLRENVAINAENRRALDTFTQQAKEIAGAFKNRDRGSQMHHALQMVLTGQDHRLLTPQLRSDADRLARALDTHKLTPVADRVEQFILYPQHAIAGRYDCILETPSGDWVLVDLKSSRNAVLYPQSTCTQLAIYRNAPLSSVNVDHKFSEGGDDVCVVEDNNWDTTLSDRLHPDIAYVLVCEPDADEAEMWTVDIGHGWEAAQLAFQVLNWRRKFNGGRDIAQLVEDGW